MKISKKAVKPVALMLAAVFMLTGLTSCKNNVQEKTSFAMGSVLDVKLFTSDTEQADALHEKIISAVSRADSLLSATKEGSDIYILNQKGSRKADPYTVSVMKDAVLLCNSFDRQIDITMGAVTELWGFSGENPSRPSDSEIEAALETKNLDNVEIISDSNIINLGEGQKADLGAFGKGAALDVSFEELSKNRIPAVISMGGTVLLYGEGQKDGKWSVGIRNPFGSVSDSFAMLSLVPGYPKNATFISTSGSYEKTFEQGGKTYHHILSPETGFPVETELVSVTVVSASGIVSDALSTACFISGADSTTLDRLGCYSAEAVFLFSDKSCYVTEGLRDSFSLIDSESFTVRDSI